MNLLMGKVTALMFLPVLLSSCIKEYSCEGCAATNKPPIALAGKDTILVLPLDSLLLDGSASFDPDGAITTFRWTKVAGSDSLTISSPNTAKTQLRIGAIGVYQLQLTITDDGGLLGVDTVQITLSPAVINNRPPVACAGANQVITLPANTATLDGSCSTDPDSNITTYQWTIISGTSSFTISDSNAAQTQVTNLVEGVYQFELKVTDAGGLSSIDTVQVTVNAAVTPAQCGNSRPQVPAQLISIGTLSKARRSMAVGAAGGKILFAGGYSATDINGTSRVDIYDIARNTWSTAELSQPRYDVTAVAAGNKILFAGGGHGTNLPGGNQNPVGKTVVDIYDASTNTWSVTVLSEARSYLCAATVGDKVFFAGGNNAHADATNKVDVYNTTTNTWSTATLSVPRAGISAVSVNNKVYFAGGFYYPPSPADTNFTVLNTIDIYDNSTNTWSTASLSEPQGEMAGVAIGGKILWAGGYAGIGGNPTYPGLTCKVQVTDAGAQSYSTSYLSCPTRVNAFPKDNKIIYFSYYLNTCDATRFDIYNPSTNTWSVGVLPIYREAASVIAVNDDVYLAGGFINNGYSNINNVSNQVYKVVF